MRARIGYRPRRRNESERGGAGEDGEQRSGEGASYRLPGLCREEGSSGVDISRGEHGDDGGGNTASVPCRVAATGGGMGDKGEQRRVAWSGLLSFFRARCAAEQDEGSTASSGAWSTPPCRAAMELQEVKGDLAKRPLNFFFPSQIGPCLFL